MQATRDRLASATLASGVLLCAWLVCLPGPALGQELGGLIFVPHDRLHEALCNPPDRVSERAVSMFIDEVAFNPDFPAAELEAAGFVLDAFVSPNSYSLTQLKNRIARAIDNGADIIHFEENVEFGGLTVGGALGGPFDVDKWSALYDTVHAEDPAVLMGLTEADAGYLKQALDAIQTKLGPERLPDFGALEWYRRTATAWLSGGTTSGPWPTFDSFRKGMSDLGIRSGMWVGDYRPVLKLYDSYPDKLLETYYETDFTFILANPEFPWDTPDPANPDEPPIKGEIDEITDSKTIVRRGETTEVAVLDDSGNVVLAGGVLSGTYTKQIQKFGVSDGFGTVGALIDADGDLWAAGGVSVGESTAELRAVAVSSEALELQDAAGDPAIVITKSGAIHARGRLIEHADPRTLPTPPAPTR